jgi:hypothetical protein
MYRTIIRNNKKKEKEMGREEEIKRKSLTAIKI